MDGRDILLGGIGVAFGGGAIAYYVAEAYHYKAIASRSIARFSALEKLLDVYGNKLTPGQVLLNATAMGLTDYKLTKKELDELTTAV